MKTKLLKVLSAAILFLIPIVGFAQAPTLGEAANFVLFTTIGPVTNSGTPYLTHLTGNVGTNTGSSTGFGNIDGQMHDGGPTSASCTADIITLYGELSGATPTFFPVSPLLGGGDILVPGIYQYPLLTAASLDLNLILDGGGDPNALFIIKIDGAFSTSANSKVILTNGALACNVFWLVEGMIDMGAGTTIRGTMLAHNAAINMAALDTLEGRALSINGAITTNSILAYTPLGCGSPFLTGPAAPALVSTAAFGVFSSIGPVTSTPITYVKGNVGSNTAFPTGFDFLNVMGIMYGPSFVTAACAGDLTNVYDYLNALPTDIELLQGDLFGHDLVLTPHTYHIAASPISLTGEIYLNAQGNPDAVFVLNLNGALITSTFSKINLINGAQAKNVYWKIDGATHVYDNSLFNGTIVGTGAITLNTGDTLNGRALTINGAVAINGSFVNTTPAPCTASAITGTDTLCVGMTTLLSNTDTGLIWHSSDAMVATIDTNTGLVTGVGAGTAIITLTNGLACQSTDTVTVNALPAPITATDSVVCVSATLTYASLTSGGTWTSGNMSAATVDSASGVITGVAVGNTYITYTLTTGCETKKSVTVNPTPNAGSITGSATMCPGNTTTLSNTTTGGIWSSLNTATATIGSATGIVTAVALGTTTISYTVTNSCGSAAATTVVTVSATTTLDPTTGTAMVCPGNTTTLINSTTSGTWSSVNTATATIGSTSGIVTGIMAGTTTISYTVTNSCGSATETTIVTVNPSPDAGTITGTTTLCPTDNATLTNIATGGVWSSVNTATATIGSSTGIVTAIALGTTTISYTVTSSCGTVAATTVVTVSATTDAGTITGTATVCPGNTITLTNTVTGGTWSSSNTTMATVGSLTGIVTGAATGTATISYTVTNSCGTASTTTIVTVSPSPNAGTITGTTVLCPANNVVLSNTISGGVWTSVTTATATIGSATGIVSGIAAGTTIISYSLTNSCGTATATTVVTINPLPNAGTITGAAIVCPGNTTSLGNTATGGTWTSSNTTMATVGSLTGIVTGAATGTATISYTVTNSCGIAFTTTIVTVSPLPNAGTITGTTILCPANNVVLSNTISGGVWTSVTTATATIGSATGIVSGIAAGTTTISYSLTNSCGIATATTVVTINPLPDAGTITGTTTLCEATNVALGNAIIGGVWSSVNTATATIGSATGIVSGIAAGTTTLSYTVANSCGIAATTVVATVNPLPNAGTITGTATVCPGDTTILSSSVTGGTWTSVSTPTATIGSATGILVGIAAGTSTISYTVTNSCGTDVAIILTTVNPLPNAGTITGVSSVCVGSNILLSNDTAGGVWSSSNSNIIVSSTGSVGGVAAGTSIVSYSFTNSCGTDVTTKPITINPLPNAGVISGASNVCSGSIITLTNTVTGGTWSSSNATATVSGGMVIGVVPGVDTIVYSVSNMCGSATAFKIVTINVLPSVPVITTQSPETVCSGTMYQNFGTTTPAAANTVYSWTAINATVWAQGTSHNNAVINFGTSGTAIVMLNSTIIATGCQSKNTILIDVTTSVSQADFVSYFSDHFVATPPTEGSYQWGYDDKFTLDSTILTGEINQDYVNANPDFENKLYWVMTKLGDCEQKTYYDAPLVIESVNNEAPRVTVFPNPATSIVNVEIGASAQGAITIEIYSTLGKKVSTISAVENKAVLDVSNLAAGIYIITCTNDGVKFNSTRFIKN